MWQQRSQAHRLYLCAGEIDLQVQDAKVEVYLLDASESALRKGMAFMGDIE